MLTGYEIREKMKNSEIMISPFDMECLGSNSYDLHIGDFVRVIRPENTVDLTKPQQYAFIDEKLPYKLGSGEIIIFTSKEIVGCKSHTFGLLSPRSNLSRSGLVFQFSHLLDTGFSGILSGVIFNPTASAFIIPKNLRIMQIMFGQNEGLPALNYNDRQWSKNKAQYSIFDILYKPDKEFIGCVEEDGKNE